MTCDEIACEFCGRCVLAGPPCCSAARAIFDARVLAEKQVEHARACQARADKASAKLRAENERLRACVKLGLEVGVFRCFVTEQYPEHNEDGCQCSAHDAFLNAANELGLLPSPSESDPSDER